MSSAYVPQYLQHGREEEGENDARAPGVIEHRLEVAEEARANERRHGGQQAEGDLVAV
jgi:hypothetical protein